MFNFSRIDGWIEVREIAGIAELAKDIISLLGIEDSFEL
jgi:hypothetical protein